jgi:prepilin-type N-terminal cleavage/methylation domain-containing protein
MRLKGFTLIELIVVIGIITLLAGIIIVAVNPARQFAQARNAQRRSDTRAAANGVQQYSQGTTPSSISHISKLIGTDAANFNLMPWLVPTYVSNIPRDPSGGTQQNTQYVIYRDENECVGVAAPLSELNELIYGGCPSFGLAFSGQSFVQIPSTPSLNVSTALTLSIWFKATDITDSQSIISRREDGGGYELRLASAVNCGGDNSMCFTLGLTTGSGYEPMGIRIDNNGLNLASNAWHHVAATYDGTIMRLYINGVLATTRLLPGTIRSNTAPLCIGAFADDNNCQESTNIFTGSLDDARVYNRVLNPSEIALLADFRPVDKTGLVGHWKFDEAKGTTTVNSVNNSIGTLEPGTGSTLPLWTIR